MALHLIDHFLLNARRFGLSQYGLLNFNENDTNSLFMSLAQSRSIATSVYGWPVRLEAFLRSCIEGPNRDDLSSVIASEPSLSAAIPQQSDRMLALSEEEIVSARAWLWKTGNYNRCKGDWLYTPNTSALAQIILANTVGGKSWKPVPDELRLNPACGYVSEYPAAPVRNYEDDRRSELVMDSYLDAFRRLSMLEEIGLPVPTAALRSIDNSRISAFVDAKPLGRYRNLPQDVVFGVLRNSIEFSLQYGADLVESYLRLAAAGKLAGTTCRQLCEAHGIQPYLTGNLTNLGVDRWRIDSQAGELRRRHSPSDSHSRFALIRQNRGLWELLRVLYGSVQACIGTLSARRQGELIDLTGERCLDISKTRLIFFNRKSGLADMREMLARPIPEVAVKLIALLERLQKGLIEIGELQDYTNLFAYPARSGSGLIVGDAIPYNHSLDYFCDYFEVSLNNRGQRYYIRQHQLRRFFAMLFFWGRAFGGVETLRWFLGHTDIRHLYHYITEAMPGAMLRSIKATYAAEQIATHAAETEQLSDLLEAHFGTRNFSVLDAEELSEYIEDLLADGAVTIEPEFLQTPQGPTYRILIQITPRVESL
jgi:hypothetical protein